MAFELRLFVAVSAFLLILTDFWVMPKGEIDLLLYVIYCEFAVFGLINFMFRFSGVSPVVDCASCTYC